MDSENLKSLGWLLVWGALFFVMMRYGCGAHMMGRHGKRKHHSSAADGDTKDPVCGMSVSTEKAAAASVLKGNTYSTSAPGHAATSSSRHRTPMLLPRTDTPARSKERQRTEIPAFTA